jgi:hypothetical protein
MLRVRSLTVAAAAAVLFTGCPTPPADGGEGEGEGIAILDRVMKKTNISLLTTKWYGFRVYR